MISVTKQEAANFRAFVKQTQYKHGGRCGSRLTISRQKECLQAWKEYPSLRYVSKKINMAPRTIKKILKINGIEIS